MEEIEDVGNEGLWRFIFRSNTKSSHLGNSKGELEESFERFWSVII
jgi:hypothetical protein